MITTTTNGYAQTDLNNIKIWEGWKTGNVIKVAGIIKYGDTLTKTDGENRYIEVQKIDGQVLESYKTIKIGHNQELFANLKNEQAVELLGYVSGGFSGMPSANNHKIEYWQDEAFHFELYFIVLK